MEFTVKALGFPRVWKLPPGDSKHLLDVYSSSEDPRLDSSRKALGFQSLYGREYSQDPSTTKKLNV